MQAHKLTLLELESQIVELKRENESLKHHISLLEKNNGEYDIANIINNIGDPIFVKDHMSRLILVNDAFCNMFKTPKIHTIGKTLAEEVAPAEREAFLKVDQEVISNGIEKINEEKLTLNGNETRVILTRKSRYISPQGEKFIVGVIHDITDSYKSKKALIKSEAELRKLNKTKDKLFSIIAHDLRSPFNNIIGIHELITESNDHFSNETKEYLSLIYATAKNTTVLLDNLLNWAKSQTGQINFNPNKLSLLDITKEIIAIESTIAKTKNINLDYHFLDEIVVSADKNMLLIILRNLISNAIKSIKRGGEVIITASVEDNDVKVTVSDNGIGIEKEILKNLFTPAHMNGSPNIIKNNDQSGLGLLLCKEFVEMHHGKIWAESELDKGSQFHFTLPL